MVAPRLAVTFAALAGGAFAAEAAAGAAPLRGDSSFGVAARGARGGSGVCGGLGVFGLLPEDALAPERDGVVAPVAGLTVLGR